MYKTQPNFCRANQEKILVKQSTYIKHDKINIINIINNTFNVHNSFLNNDNRYMKVTLKFKQIEFARKLISANFCEF